MNKHVSLVDLILPNQCELSALDHKSYHVELRSSAFNDLSSVIPGSGQLTSASEYSLTLNKPFLVNIGEIGGKTVHF